MKKAKIRVLVCFLCCFGLTKWRAVDFSLGNTREKAISSPGKKSSRKISRTQHSQFIRSSNTDSVSQKSKKLCQVRNKFQEIEYKTDVKTKRREEKNLPALVLNPGTTFILSAIELARLLRMSS